MFLPGMPFQIFRPGQVPPNNLEGDARKVQSMKTKRTIRVSYPVQSGRLVLRTEKNWDLNLEADSVAEDGTLYTFTLEADKPFLYFKPCLIRDKQFHWAEGANSLALMFEPDLRVGHPHFFAHNQSCFSKLISFSSPLLGREHKMQVYLPPGYHENTLTRYRVIYMHDGQNLFFPEDAFLGQTWDVGTTLGLLDQMNAIDNFIVVGLHNHPNRMEEYTRPGYETYARSVVEEVKPLIDRTFRTRPDKLSTAVMGSSLGGVVSFYMAWQYPETFVAGMCMSSTFTYRDDLLERVYSEPYRPVAFYLDSGWPGDNYEVTLSMASALIHRGWQLGRDVLHLSYPMAAHNEAAWATRLHIPCQLFARSLREFNIQQHGSLVARVGHGPR